MFKMNRRNLLKLASLSPFIAGRTANAQTEQKGLSKGPHFFVRGVYQQPVENMSAWKSRGINTIFTMNNGADFDAWTNEAVKLGLYMVREPAGVDYSGDKPSFRIIDRAAFEKDLSEPALIALALFDEPSNPKPGGADITYDQVFYTPEEIDGIAQEWSSGGKPLWINHVGNHINNIYLQDIMSDYADSPKIDWLGHDCYPISTGQPMTLELDNYLSTHQGHAIDRLSKWSGGKPQFSFVGLTQYDQQIGRGTTPQEFGVQIWSSIVHGAVGVIYFTFMFSPEFSYDATPDELLSELSIFHAQIHEIEDILIDTKSGGRRPSTLLKSVKDPDAESEPSLPYPFEACSIQTEQGEFKIIVNLSDSPAELTYLPWDISNVRFDAYDCKRGYLIANAP